MPTTTTTPARLLGRLLAAAAAAACGAAAQLTFQPCDYSAAGAKAQAFVVSAGGGGIALASAPAQCLQLSSGCCFGEDVRGGDLVGLGGCGGATAAFAWPSAAFAAAPNAIVADSTAGAGTVSPSVNGAPLVVSAGGRAFPGAAAQLHAYLGAADAAFVANGSSSGAGAHLVHAASGLCLSSAGARSTEDPTLSLAPCDAKRQAPGDWFASQLFTVPAQGGAPGALRNSRGNCASAYHVWGAADAVAGEVRAISGAQCGPAGTGAQTFSFLANGTLALASFASRGDLVLDAGAGNWRGAPVSLTPSAGAATSVFRFAAVGADPAVGTLTHAATGLCLDAAAVPFGFGCLHPSVRALPYCDATLPLETRVADLVGRLTLTEAQAFTGAGEFEEPCVTIMPRIARLDIPESRQLVEVTSMASSSCSTPYNGACATSFGSGLLLGGSFNRSVWLQHGVVVGREMRALSNIAYADNNQNGNFNTLSGHGPDINQPRDPRNGRQGELISEDGVLTGRAAEKVVRGMQFGADVEPADFAGPHVMLASVKHFNSYSLETNRFGSKGNVSMFDLWDSYLPQYARAMVQGGSAGTMCSYFSMHIEGTPLNYVPSCSDPYLLTDVVREFWGRPDATHLTDCGAVWNQAIPESGGGNGYVSNLTLAAAASINSGCDMNSNTVTPTQLTLAVQLGLVDASTVRAAAGRVLAQRFRTGHFDPLETPAAQPLLALGAADIGTAASRAVAADGVAQGIVLVKNDNGALPISPGKRVALLGPAGNSFDALRGDCYCSGYCQEGSACFPSLETAVTNANAGGATITYAGCTTNGGNDSSWGAAIAAVATSDVVILALGTDTSTAGEGGDRGDIGLPGMQEAFGVAVLKAATAAKVPVVLLLLHNLPASFDLLVRPADGTYKAVDAIVDAWAPNAYADTVAGALFGKINRWGKSTMTVYPKAYAQAISIFEFSMTKPPGRSYKYYDNSVGAPLINFGEGKSYSTFSVVCAGGLAPGEPLVHIACNVTNAAGPDGDEVLMVYHRPSAAIVGRVAGAHPLPLRALVDFERVSVGAGAVGSVRFDIPVAEALAFVNEDGATTLYAGPHFLDVSNGNGVNVTIPVVLEAAAPVTLVSVPPKRRAA